ncbi:DUF1318 domain-containing protein [Phaeovibrio sulfidiphilus]|uniref:DUF1318 domain-containing protein n=1 Tax=Phaeovibrio sulfidiphilus TaxID=1220600 RepID=A0A8J6YLI1_9PROT|nr:DUF1318 domain-containing protein [Phaeovibrio sulfidiphilus]MBE1236970.1 DUF1318 domain-containing protein [Phaeovibrio sulfidiphilus]
MQRTFPLLSSGRRGLDIRSVRLAAACLLASLGLALPGPAWALSLQDARSRGAVCETTDGLVRATTQSPEVSALVSETNARRMQAYKAEAARHGVPVSEIQGVSATQLRDRHAPCP